VEAKMNVLVIYTHPNQESLNYSFLQSSLRGLKNNPEVDEIQVLDLYQEGFDPALVFHKKKPRRALHNDPEMAPYRDQLNWADLLVFIYPIWWGRPPAMLLGYLDRLLTTGFAYRFPDQGLFPEGLLKGKKAVCISTMKGPGIYPRLILGNAHKILMGKAVLNFVGIKNVKFFQFGGVEKNDGKNQKYLFKIEKYLKKVS
jgi:NAD(P)H dehydrogenase (quinone)